MLQSNAASKMPLGDEPGEPAFKDELGRKSELTMSQMQMVDRDDYDPSWITGEALERHFSMQEALFEFSRVFRDEENDRAPAIVGVGRERGHPPYREERGARPARGG
jgi:hypothetical protein